jgi:hypothetical protein
MARVVEEKKGENCWFSHLQPYRLLGGVVALISSEFSHWLIVAEFLAVSALVIATRHVNSHSVLARSALLARLLSGAKWEEHSAPLMKKRTSSLKAHPHQQCANCF